MICVVVFEGDRVQHVIYIDEERGKKWGKDDDFHVVISTDDRINPVVFKDDKTYPVYAVDGKLTIACLCCRWQH